MKKGFQYDALVVGAGPNGLAAAITCAQAGRSVLVMEANSTLGGGARTAELTLPGFRHDTCSAVHPMAIASPFLRGLPLTAHGLEWIHPPACLAHPFDDGTAAALYPSIERTAQTLGGDAAAYRRLVEPLARRGETLFDEILQPPRLPRHPLLLACFGLKALQPAARLSRARFREKWARGLFAGLAAHSFLPLTQAPSSAIGLVLGLAGHGRGWPIPRGGSGRITEAMASYLRSLGGEIVLDTPVRSTADLPPARAVFFDLVPRRVLEIAGEILPASYRRALERFKPGPGVFKVDYALSSPIPWKAPACAEAGTVHLGGMLEELIESELAPWTDRPCEKPYVLLAQPTVFDPGRAPAGRHIAWSYCHVKRGSTEDMTDRIERQIERFAPGFRDTVLARHVTTPAELEKGNANYIGGDISAGIADLRQAFFRPVARWNPYAIPVKGWYFCSASTPPGAGVHGMCGYHAARRALGKDL